LIRSWTQASQIRRDALESQVFHMAVSRGASMIGICRGAQLITALCGGSLFQDVAGHCSGDHLIKTESGRVLKTTSVHHQMMNPFVLPADEYKVIAWAGIIDHARPGAFDPISSIYLDGNDDMSSIPDIEPEVVWYPKQKALCIQGHPEFAADGSQFVSYCRDLVKEYIL